MAEKPRISTQLAARRQLTIDELIRIDPIEVRSEGAEPTEDGCTRFLFTVGGRLDMVELDSGCTVLGDVIMVHAADYAHAVRMAEDGLLQTLVALKAGRSQQQIAPIPVLRTASERVVPLRRTPTLRIVPPAPRPGAPRP